MDDQIIKNIIKQVIAQLETEKTDLSDGSIPIAVSARHVHLKQSDVEKLFGEGYELTKRSELSQPGQFAANETIVIAGSKGSIERVRILGPARSLSQVEVSLTDAFSLGIKPPLRESGDIKDSESITLIGPQGTVHLDEGLIVAQAHIHMNPKEAKVLNVTNNELVEVAVDGVRPIVIKNVKIRVSEKYVLEMHIDTDEANSGFITQGTFGQIQKEGSPQIKSLPVKTKVREEKINEYSKKLLSKDDLEKINEKKIKIKKNTIVTALAYDRARELNKTIYVG